MFQVHYKLEGLVMTATHYADSDKNLWSSEAEQINAAATSQQGPLKINQTQKRILFAEQTVMFIFRRISLIFAFYYTISVWKTVRPLKTVQMNQSDSWIWIPEEWWTLESLFFGNISLFELASL